MLFFIYGQGCKTIATGPPSHKSLCSPNSLLSLTLQFWITVINEKNTDLEFNEPNLFCTWRPFIERQSLSFYRYCILLQIIQQQRKSSSSRNVSMNHPFYWLHLDLAYSEVRLPLCIFMHSGQWVVGYSMFSRTSCRGCYLCKEIIR